ncbi:nucleoside triphosphate pyrophosphohydrolase [Biformimicrobium ophioploci]|uniref:Nucleoside triphosphate pyrophosphohydrolase n=1 Tax=Biformimicrobium ophioploci TaxID=3036711 RepID=A0ABQ6LZU8_9GAMM|nr:nucleoside triphosphate pyrophosphohydrolase [Microbulbifer sp. NKW57]GMG87606.1 nucleoside triphosphate pyrophosphohydrolase [Microbulbifer sp. NKW57]
MTEKYNIDDLQYLMARLRDPDGGCPWDLKQTFATIVPSTIEEAYEVAEAIEREDFGHLPEELGDLLFQVIFYAQMGSEQERFSFDGIVHTLVAKLVRRHPHVFPTGELRGERREGGLDEQKVRDSWESIKEAERTSKGEQGALAGVATALPALTRAAKLQKRAARTGFDWPDIDQVLAKAQEEIGEVREAIATGDLDAAREEVGDLLFAVVNVARHLKADPETQLRATNRKFERRFAFVESAITGSGRVLEDAGLEEMDAAWDQAKERGL